MGKINVEKTPIEGLYVITPTVFGDNRGYFMETYNIADFKEAGIDCVFVQDNQSASKKGVIRGLHFQINYPQDKLVRVIRGFSYRRILPTVFWFCPITLSLLTSVRSFIIRMMRVGSSIMIRISESIGLLMREWS